MGREALALDRARAQSAHEVALQSELLFGDLAGELLVVGEPPASLLLAAGVATTDLTLVGRGRPLREAKRWIETLTPCSVHIADREGGGLPRLEQSFGGALVWDLPAKDSIDVLERALFSVADGGRLLVSVGRRGGSDQRIERLLQALGGGQVRPIAGAPLERLSLAATRRAPYPAEMMDEAPESLPITVVVRHLRDPQRTEALLVDLLLRQLWPAAKLLVLDDSERIADQIPEDLFGLPERSATEIALVLGGAGRDAGEAFNDALGAVETPFVCFLQGGDRVAPGHLVTLGMHLERSAASVVLSDALSAASGDAEPRLVCAPHKDPERLLRGLLDGGQPALGGALWRVDRLRAAEGFDPMCGESAALDLWVRFAENEPIPVLPIPLCAVSCGHPGAVSGAAWASAAARVGPNRWAREFPEVAKEDREAIAQRALGYALLCGGAPAAAAEVFEAGLKGANADPEPFRFGAVLAALCDDEHERAAALAAGAVGRREGLFVQALAHKLAGRLAEAEAAVRRGALEVTAPFELASLLEIAILLDPASAAARSFVRWRRAQPSFTPEKEAWLAGLALLGAGSDVSVGEPDGSP